MGIWSWQDRMVVFRDGHEGGLTASQRAGQRPNGWGGGVIPSPPHTPIWPPARGQNRAQLVKAVRKSSPFPTPLKLNLTASQREVRLTVNLQKNADFWLIVTYNSAKHLFLEKKLIFLSSEEKIPGYLQTFFDRNWAKNNSSTELQCCWSMHQPWRILGFNRVSHFLGFQFLTIRQLSNGFL